MNCCENFLVLIQFIEINREVLLVCHLPGYFFYRWKGIKPTVAILSRGISHPAGGWRPGQSWQRTGHCRSVVWARTKPPPPKYAFPTFLSTICINILSSFWFPYIYQLINNNPCFPRRNELAGWWGSGIGTHPGWGGCCGGRCWGNHSDGGCCWGPSCPTADCVLPWAA